MAECDVDCSLVPSTEDVDCGDIEVEIPEIPTDYPDITIPGPGTVTEEDITGNGIFDIYMRAGSNQLQIQYDEGRIKGKEYADSFVQMIQVMMTEANKFAIGMVQAEIAANMFPVQYLTAGYDAALKEAQAAKMTKEVELLCQQIAELKANGGVERMLKTKQSQTQVKQAELYKRQIKGFDDKSSIDASKIIMDAWAVHAVEEPDPKYDTGFDNGGVAADDVASGKLGNLSKMSNLAN